VALVRTVVVCAPKIFSVIPEPKAAPNPSLRGRCMRTTKVSRTQTITRMVSKIGIKIDSHIRAGNMGRSQGVVKDEVRERRNGEWAMGPGNGRAKNSAPMVLLLFALFRAGFEPLSWRPDHGPSLGMEGRSVFLAGIRIPRCGSKPARMSVAKEPKLGRAEFFALPFPDSIAVSLPAFH
jgi:hypothetical protein